MHEKFLKEDLLQYLWNIGDFDIRELKTTKGESIQILKRGVLNHDAGPDFLDAKVKINETIWAGNVEIHKYSSDWNKHQHQNDPAYDNVILHVVFRDDKPVVRADDSIIPCLELHSRVRPESTKAYHKLLYNKYWIPCQHFFPKVHQFKKMLWFEKLLIERLEQKTDYYNEILEKHINDWETLLYVGIAKYLSPNINRSLMEDLTLRTPLNILLKHKDDLSIIEAILFGQSGLLDNNDSSDAYHTQLRKDYSFYKKKYNISPMQAVNWKFSKMRPSGFPTIRIAQLASFIYSNGSSFGKIIDTTNIADLSSIFDIEASEYWKTHYQFGSISKSKTKKIGKLTQDILLINVVVPILFLYGLKRDDQLIKDRSLALLTEISPEKNSIIDKWKMLGQDPKSAFDTQALLTLKKEYCDKKRCLSCDIGNTFMNAMNEIVGP